MGGAPFAFGGLGDRQFERRLEVVGERAPLLSLEIIHQCHPFGMGQTLLPEELPHMRPVLLFAVRVVVLAIRAAAGPRQLHRPPGQMFVKRPV